MNFGIVLGCEKIQNPEDPEIQIHCDLTRLHLLHKTCWVDFTVGSPDGTVRVNAYTVHFVTVRIMQIVQWGVSNF